MTDRDGGDDEVSQRKAVTVGGKLSPDRRCVSPVIPFNFDPAEALPSRRCPIGLFAASESVEYFRQYWSNDEETLPAFST